MGQTHVVRVLNWILDEKKDEGRIVTIDGRLDREIQKLEAAILWGYRMEEM